MGNRPAILVDTNIILEAVRVGAWERLRAHESVVTVSRCREEALSGVPGVSVRFPVSPSQLEPPPPLSVVQVSQSDLVYLALAHPESATLDDGERHLLAHAFALKRGVAGPGVGGGGMGEALRAAGLPTRETRTEFVIVSADQAAVRVAIAMGLGEQVMSLEEVLRAAGVSVNGSLKGHYTKGCLEAWKTRHALGMV